MRLIEEYLKQDTAPQTEDQIEEESDLKHTLRKIDVLRFTLNSQILNSEYTATEESNKQSTERVFESQKNDMQDSYDLNCEIS